MPFFFKNHPRVDYDISMLGLIRITDHGGHADIINVQNPIVRYKIIDAVKNKAALYYTHDIVDGESAQFIAHRYYGDETLDWIIYIVNDIVDPLYQWPLSYNALVEYCKSKYGSLTAAYETKQYEKLIQNQSVLYDGTIVPKKYVVVDQTTYESLDPSQRREITYYAWEEQENDKKRTIKILHKRYLPNVLNEVKSIFS